MTVVLEDIFKSKTNFENYIVNSPMPLDICEVMQDYPNKNTEVIADLTQNIEKWLNITGDKDCKRNQYIIWIITNEKEKIMNSLNLLNECSNGRFGVFVFKAYLNKDIIAYECLLKPDIPTKATRNNNTPAKKLQKNYWELYITECDLSENPDMQIKESAPRHYQYISIGKAGVQIVQTVNTKDNYAATKIMINNNKEIFNKLLEQKEKIEEVSGILDW